MAWVGKRCNCRAPDGRLLGKSCADLAKRGHGEWWVRYEAPRTPDGSRRRPWSGPYPTKTDADAAASKLETDVGAGKPAPDGSLRVRAFLRRWLDGKKALAPSTRHGYATHIALYLDPGIGHLKLADLREHHLVELYEAMGRINRPAAEELPTGARLELMRRLLAARAGATWREGLHNERPLSPARIRRVHATLSSALTTAMRQRLISHDPSKNVELEAARKRRPLVWTGERVAAWERAGGWGNPAEGVRPAARPGPVMVWTPTQAGRMLDWLEERGDPLYALWHLVATRGLRRGEVARLEWTDVDLDAKTVSVLEDEDAEKAAGIKSDSSRRVVILDAENVGLLKRLRQSQREDRFALGERWCGSGRVFVDEFGAALGPNYLTDRWERLVRWSLMPPVRLHDLRHCAATIMLSAGVDMKYVSATLGHRQYWFTADTYASVVPEVAEAAAEATVAAIPRARRKD